MKRSFFRPLSLLLCLGTAGLVGSCTDDSIPTSPSPPFLFSQLEISKDTSPIPGTTMSQGLHTVRFSVAYTLAPQDDKGRATLGLFAFAVSTDAKDSVSVLQTLPSTRSLTSSGGTIADTLRFTVPPGALSVTVGALIDTLPFNTSPLLFDSQSWRVQ